MNSIGFYFKVARMFGPSLIQGFYFKVLFTQGSYKITHFIETYSFHVRMFQILNDHTCYSKAAQ